MKKLPLVLISLGFLFGSFGIATAITVFNSDQVGTSESNGYVLQTNGTVSTWVATSSLGISGGSGTPGGTAGQVQYNGSGSFAGVSTTSVSCSGSASCTSFTILGSSPITISASGSGGSGTVGTSTHETAGGIAYWTTNSATPALLGEVATGTVSAGSSAITVTAGRAAIGGALAIDCATASGSQNGCLSSTDWTTFNNKQATLAFTSPLMEIGTTVSFTGLATTSQPASSNILTSNGTNGVYGTATSSLGVTGPITFSGTLGAQVGGSGGNFACATCDTFANPGYPFALAGNATSSLTQFNGNASTTQLSVITKAYFGASATTTIDSSGNIVIPSSSSLTNTGVSNGCATWASGVLGTTGTACGSSSGGSAYPFYTATLYGTTTSATSTSLYTGGSLFASSTLQVGSSTSIGTSTIISDLNVGLNGASNPAFQVLGDNVTVPDNGLQIAPAAGGGVVNLNVISGQTNNGLNINAKGTANVALVVNAASDITAENGGVVFHPGAVNLNTFGAAAFQWNQSADSINANTNFNIVDWALNNSQTNHTNGLTPVQNDFLISGGNHHFNTYSTGNSMGYLSALDVQPSTLITAGGNGTTTNAIGIKVDAQADDASTTNTFGFYDTASTGAVNNYAAQFYGQLAIGALAGTTQPGNNLFVIASSTATPATTTLFSINNAGTITTSLSTGAVSDTSGVLAAGTLSLANGGTNNTAYSSNSLIWYNGTSLTSTTTSPLTVGYLIATTTTATSTYAGSLAIATTSPTAFVVQDQYNSTDFQVGTASTTGPIFAVEATTTGNPILFSEDQYGHLTASSTGATPAISSCGTGSPAMGASANDAAGSFTTGTSASSCTVTFAHAYSSTPIVVISDSNTSAVADVSAISTTAFTVSLASALSADTVYYMVEMP